jgi:hypothetical protein
MDELKKGIAISMQGKRAAEALRAFTGRRRSGVWRSPG